MASNVKLKWYINEVDTDYLSAIDSSSVSVAEYKQMISQDPPLPNFVKSLRFRLLPSHSGLNEIKLRCVATYSEVIREHTQSLNIFSYNMQAVEAQSTSFTTASSSSSLRPLSSSASAFNVLLILLFHLVMSDVRAPSLTLFSSLCILLFVRNFPVRIYTDPSNDLKLHQCHTMTSLVPSNDKDTVISLQTQEQLFRPLHSHCT